MQSVMPKEKLQLWPIEGYTRHFILSKYLTKNISSYYSQSSEGICDNSINIEPDYI